MPHRASGFFLSLGLSCLLLMPAGALAAQTSGAPTPAYTIALTSGFAGTLSEGSVMLLTYTLTQQGTATPAPQGTEVQLLSQTQGGKATAQKLLAHAAKTDVSGKVFLAFIGASGSAEAPGFLPRTVKLFAKAGNSESVASDDIAEGSLPPTKALDIGGRFLTGVATQKLSAAAAKALCASHGGTLPKLNAKDALGRHDVTGPTVNLDGFGPVQEPAMYVTGDAPKKKPTSTENHAAQWYAITELPGADYWTGTHLAGRPDDAWYFFEKDGVVKLGFDDGGSSRYAVCVP